MPTLPEIFEPTPLNPYWLEAPEEPRFHDGRIHVWRARLDDSRLLALAGSVLSGAEIVSAERCLSYHERDRHLAMTAFLREVLSRYIGAAPDEISFTRDSQGRLALALSTIRFNFSHAENVALIAVAPCGEIGLEIEQVRDDLPFDEMAAHFFEPEDHWGIRITRCPTQKASKFFDFWTGNEAFAQTSADDLTGGVSIHRLYPMEGFAAAIAIAGRETEFSFWDWN